MFQPYLLQGKLMSCAGMRYARELDEPRAALEDYGEMRLVRGAILNSWEKYGIHLVDAVLSVVAARPVSIVPLPGRHAALAIGMDDGSLFQIDALGDIGMCFRIDFFGTRKITSHEITDNFTMFRRMMYHFIRMVETGSPSIDPSHTIDTMRLMMAGVQALADGREVPVHDIVL